MRTMYPRTMGGMYTLRTMGGMYTLRYSTVGIVHPGYSTVGIVHPGVWEGYPCTPWGMGGIPLYTLVYTTLCTPGLYHPVYTLLYHPGYTTRIPRTDWCTATALPRNGRRGPGLRRRETPGQRASSSLPGLFLLGLLYLCADYPSGSRG